MIEHDLELSSQLDPLSEEINALAQRLKSIDVENMIGNSQQKLEEWRSDSHRTIEQFFEEKCRELDRCLTQRLEKRREEISRIRTKIEELSREQETTHQDIDSLTVTVRDLESEINQIEQASLQLQIKSLTLDENFIRIEHLDRARFDLSSLATVGKSISYSRENWAPLACNDEHLLIHQEPNLCLVDDDLNILRQNSWIYGTIYDMCWSATLNRFIVINGSDVFLVDEQSVSIENIPTLKNHKWLSCTTSESSLFLSTKVWGSSVMEFTLLPTVSLLKQWQAPDTCTRNEVINSLVYSSNGTLAMMIKNPAEKTIHIEMRSATTLDRLWAVRLNIPFSQNIRTRCCLLDHQELLVVDRNTSRLFHISKDGRVLSSSAYSPPPFSATRFGRDILAISTARGVNLHRL